MDHASPRLEHTRLAPDAFRAMLGVSETVKKSSLGKQLLALVDSRVSQLNGCAYCLDMHTRELAAAGETLQRIACLAAWEETSLYTPRERAALKWAESLTLLRETQAPQERFDALRDHFSDQEIAELSFAIAQINAWNRLGVGMRLPVGPRPIALKAA
ncbi:carboxymuconolactone decarboxylase family protein [Ramlibacter humi]|uniref:Carboxymuconolactone decarboxylase family protein n=1 Tax=Ramlibacter humi TaxID=2530451 RepID=A0A4Z0BRQ7_9BURK|nr:carboxymuconolactone decarboxylase family protein [Ramlibacter humi]TFZ01993.1 carboxymuconolactone decarboxylase family protein [Ramlibacter humi]